jgi:hypothetical protein
MPEFGAAFFYRWEQPAIGGPQRCHLPPDFKLERLPRVSKGKGR